MEDAAQVVGREGSFADEEEGADKVADHVMKETVAANGVNQVVVGWVAGPVRGKNSTDVGGWAGGLGIFRGRHALEALGIDGGEGCEVVFADDEGGGGGEGGLVERIGVMPAVTGEEGRTNIAAEDAIGIGFGAGGFAGVKFRGDGTGFKDADGGREEVVEGARPVFTGDGGGGREAGDLGKGMDAGVGAAGALGEYVFAGQASNGRSECALDGGAAGLDLPPGEVRAVVGKDQSEIGHVLFRVLRASKIIGFVYRALPPTG